LRDIPSYVKLQSQDLAITLGEVVGELVIANRELGAVTRQHAEQHIKNYYLSSEESHAAKTRYADSMTQVFQDEIFDWQANIASLTVEYNFLLELFRWRRAV
jgi:hypothetical protein